MLIPVECPFHCVGVDVIQFVKFHSDNQYAIVFADYLTKWPEVLATKDQTALIFAKLHICGRNCLLSWGSISVVVESWGCFLFYLLIEICKLLGTNKLNTTAYHPQTNGLTEQFNHTLTSSYAGQKVEQSGKDWDQHLPYIFFACRASMQESVKESSFYLSYGRGSQIANNIGYGY